MEMVGDKMGSENEEYALEDREWELIEALAKSGALLFETKTLKSGRVSPYFIDFGEIKRGIDLSIVGKAYADVIQKHFPAGSFNVLFGPAYKGIDIANAIITQLPSEYSCVEKAYNRKEAKTHGERGVIVGHQISPGDKVLLVDDVWTTGETKEEIVNLIDAQSHRAKIVGVVGGVDREELDKYRENSVKKFSETTGANVVFVTSISDITSYLHNRSVEGIIYVDDITRNRIDFHLNKFGVKYNEENIRLVKDERSIIPSCDVRSLEKLEDIVRETNNVPGIGAYKLGRILESRFGLPKIVETARKHTDKSLIYDGQKLGTDIPDLADEIAISIEEAGFDAAILFPLTGPVTQYKWTESLKMLGVRVLVGGDMTHLAYKASDGGYISDQALSTMYMNGAQQSVVDFVVPGTKLDVLPHYKSLIEAFGIGATFYAPGFVAQGGEITEAAKIAGRRWHAIVGRGIYEASDIARAAEMYTKQILESLK